MPRSGCVRLLQGRPPDSAGGPEVTLHLQPISWEEACAFVDEHHSTHPAPQGWKFGVAVNDGSRVVGVATVGHPVAPSQDDGWTLEVTRCCTDGSVKNAASMLYATCWRAARAMGYRRLITYTLVEEEAIPLKATAFKVVGQTRGDTWNRRKRPRVDIHPTGQKTLWEVAK